jgi:NADH:ubiquinone oxidoreductase subunit 3 (subunit A)
MKSTAILEIKYGVLISVFTLIWIVFEQLLGFQDEYVDLHPVVSTLSLIIPIIGLYLAIREFKMARANKYNFQKGFGIGFRITLINSVLIIPTIYLFYKFINPDWTFNMMNNAKLKALEQGEDPLKAIEEARSYFSMKYYMIQSLISTFIFGTLMSSILAFMLKNRGRSKTSWS